MPKGEVLSVDFHQNETRLTSNTPTQASISAKNGGSKNKEEYLLRKK